MGFLSLVAKLGIDISGYETGLKRAESSVSKFSRGANGALKSQIAGAIGVGAILAASKAAVDYASHINDVSTRVGIGTEKLQEYAYAAKQTGGSLDDFAGVARKISQSRSEALRDPTGAAAQGFAKLGAKAQDLKTMRIEDIIDNIGRSFEKAKDPQELLTAGFAVMGKGALPVIGAMREGLAGFGEDARNAGLIIKDETIMQLDDMGDSVDRLKTSLIAATAEGLGKFASGLTNVWRTIKSTVAGVATYAGALSAGASDKDAAKMGYNARVAEVEKDVASDMAFQQTKQKRKQMASLMSGDFSEVVKNGPASYQKANVNSLQQIGAFSGVDPIVRVGEKQVSILQNIKDNTKKMADAKSDGGTENYS